MSKVIFILACCIVGGAALALIKGDRDLGRALRFEIAPWT
jgi:hypothetical protein